MIDGLNGTMGKISFNLRTLERVTDLFVDFIAPY